VIVHIHFLDPYQSGSSLVHEIDARVKLVLTLAFVLTTAVIPVGAWPLYLLLLVLVMSLEVLSGVGIGFFLKRSALAALFILAALPLIFTVPGKALFAIQLGSWEFSASLAGIDRFLSIALKSWISVQMAIVLTATTQFPDVLSAMRALRVPRMLVAIFGLMWRYLFVFADEALRLLRARTARSGESEDENLHSGGSITWRAQIAGGLAGNLFVRSLERSERIYAAMLARGYDGEIRSLPGDGMKSYDWFVLAIGGLILSAVLLLSASFVL
jgi:cobalt/nickel transport system permease protein